jgi:CO/xanthine dehydrogenase FAD-binding subunit
MDLGSVQSLVIPRSRSDLHDAAPGTAILAGGTLLFCEARPELSRLIDITALGWRPISLDGGQLEIAATCTIAELLAGVDELFPDRQRWPAVPLFQRSASALLASWKVWNTATVGGNLCAALPVGAMISLFTALRGEALIWRRDGEEDSVPVERFVVGNGANVLDCGDVLRSIRVPVAELEQRHIVRRAALAPFGGSGIVVSGSRDGDAVRLVITAAVSRPRVVRVPRSAGSAEFAASLEGIDDWLANPRGSHAWRRAVTAALAAEIVDQIRTES